ncbi:MAG: response regulator [Gemmataceae bacterium]
MPDILLIEDNSANLELMSYLLRAFGYNVKTATDGGIGLEAARGESFDLIVCDIQMPVLDGYEVARRLKADPARRSAPLLAVTALAMVGDRDKVLSAGFDGYVAKPIDPETFVRQVEAFLRPEMRKDASLPLLTVTTAVSSYPRARYTVLVVDNMPVNLDLARYILEPWGYRVLTANGPLAALALTRAHPCDLILSDVCMADGSGFDLIRTVKSDPALRDVPFIFLTSTMTNETDRAAGLTLGAARYLFRPLEPDSLLAEIEACLREAGKV